MALVPEARAFDVPALTGPVIDEVGVLSAQMKSELSRALMDFKNKNGIQIQVFVPKSLQGEEIASVTLQIFDKWKLGDEKTDKGLLFLIAPNEKRMRIEVGQGLEGDIPDVIAKRIISDVVKPYFQAGDFQSGILQGVLSVQSYLGDADGALKSQVQSQPEPEGEKGGGGWIILIVAGFWLLLFMMNPSLALYMLFAAGRGGGGGGGSWSGGGGRSSGGGASGSW